MLNLFLSLVAAAFAFAMLVYVGVGAFVCARGLFAVVGAIARGRRIK